MIEWIDSAQIFVSNLLQADAKSVLGALVLLLATTTVALLGYILRTAWNWSKTAYVAWRKRRRFLVDLIIFAEFAQKNINERFDRKSIDDLKTMILSSPPDIRLFVQMVNDDQIFEDIKTYRHTFRAREIAALDRFTATIKLYITYYKSMGSKDFGHLSSERKCAALEVFFNLTREVAETTKGLQTDIAEIKRLWAKVAVVSHVKKTSNPQLVTPSPVIELRVAVIEDDKTSVSNEGGKWSDHGTISVRSKRI